MINPRLLAETDEQEEHIEQSPSLIETMVLTTRPKLVKVEYFDLEGDL